MNNQNMNYSECVYPTSQINQNEDANVPPTYTHGTYDARFEGKRIYEMHGHKYVITLNHGYFAIDCSNITISPDVHWRFEMSQCETHNGMSSSTVFSVVTNLFDKNINGDVDNMILPSDFTNSDVLQIRLRYETVFGRISIKFDLHKIETQQDIKLELIDSNVNRLTQQMNERMNRSTQQMNDLIQQVIRMHHQVNRMHHEQLTMQSNINNRMLSACVFLGIIAIGATMICSTNK